MSVSVSLQQPKAKRIAYKACKTVLAGSPGWQRFTGKATFVVRLLAKLVLADGKSGFAKLLKLLVKGILISLLSCIKPNVEASVIANEESKCKSKRMVNEVASDRKKSLAMLVIACAISWL